MKTPWHLWVIGIFALLWNGMGALDYVMTQSNNEAYLSQFSDAERAFFTSIPTWAVFFWALSIWSAVLGSVLILARRRWATPLFAIAVVSFLIVAAQNYLLASPTMAEVVGTFAVVFSIVIFIITVGLWWYAKKMSESGVLR